MRNNIIIVPLKQWQSVQNYLYQYDYGQKILFTEVELPANYEVHFSNTTEEESISMLGDETGVDIPDELLLSGEPVHVWLFLHAGEDDGETVFHVTIPVKIRSKPSDIEPTEVEQNIIAQTIAALNSAVETVNEDISYVHESVEHVEEVAGDIVNTVYTALQEAKDSGEFKGEKGDKGDKGDRGEQGVRGERGERGEKGEQGPIGPDGNGIVSVTFNNDTLDFYFDNGRHFYTPSLRGPQGYRGEQGVQGPEGPAGPEGKAGPQGIQGIQGVQGPQGEPGAKGDKGDPFTVKKTFASIEEMNNYSGSDVVEGDFVLISSTIEDPDNAKLFVKSANGYTFITDLSGAQGVKGDKGDTGPQGIQGVQGEQGPQGVKGDTGPQGPKGDPGSAGAVIDDEAGAGDTDKTWSADKLVSEFSVATAEDIQVIINGDEEDDSMIVDMEYSSGGFVSQMDAAEIAQNYMSGKSIILHFIPNDENNPDAYAQLIYYAPAGGPYDEYESWALASYSSVYGYDLVHQLSHLFTENGKLRVYFAD